MTTKPANTDVGPQGSNAGGKGLTLSWGWLSIALGVLAAGSLGTLVVVTSIKNLDTLSTVALALAVISFAAQLIVTTVQSYQSSQVNADTKSALADMRATTSSLLTNQRDQFDKVLHAALQTAIPAAVQDVERHDDSDSDEGLAADRIKELEDRLTVRFNEALGSFKGLSPIKAQVPAPSPAPTRDSKLLDLLSTYPEQEEGKPVVELIGKMGARGLAALGQVGSNVQRNPRTDRTLRFRRSAGISPGMKELVDSGILREVADENSRALVFELTPTGMTALRLLMGAGDKPDWVTV
jgi:hypothetical protein